MLYSELLSKAAVIFIPKFVLTLRVIKSDCQNVLPLTSFKNNIVKDQIQICKNVGSLVTNIKLQEKIERKPLHIACFQMHEV